MKGLQMPVNLKTTYGKRFKVDYDRDISGKPVSITDPWMMRLKSYLGHVYVHSETQLGFATEGRPTSLNNHPDLTLVQDGSDGRNYVFDADKLDSLANLLRIRRRKQVGPEERERLIKMTRQYRYRGKHD